MSHGGYNASYDGSTPAYCSLSNGCQSKYGSCTINSPTVTVSLNGKCGKDSKQTRQGSTFGNCCSQHGCGKTTAYCGVGCQSGYGSCSGAASSISAKSSSRRPSSTTSSSATLTCQSSSSSSTSTSSTSSSTVAFSSSTSYLSTSSSTTSFSSTSYSSTSSSTTSSSSSTSSSPSPIVTLQIVQNPSFEIADPTNPPNPADWTVDRLYVIDADNTGRVQSNTHTGMYSIHGHDQVNAGYDVELNQTVTVVPGASYNIQVWAYQTTQGFCSISIYLNTETVREFVEPGTTYGAINATVTIPATDPAQQPLLIDGACSLPNTASPANYDLFIDDVTMTLAVPI